MLYTLAAVALEKKVEKETEKKTEKKAAKLLDDDAVMGRVVVVKPPWGQRLKGPDATDTPQGQAELMASLEARWHPTLVALVVPRIAGAKPKVPGGWIEHPSIEFRAGGIPVRARFFSAAPSSRSQRKQASDR